MTTVVTGATGHVGINLVRALVAESRPVRALIHTEPGVLEDLDIERVRADVTAADTLATAFEGAETVFHLAACISIDGDRGGEVTRTNVDGVRNVARAALHAGVRRFVHVSSIHVFHQAPLDEPLDEDRARCLEPSCFAYDRSKAHGELALREVIAQGLDATIVNPTAIVGPEDHGPSRMGRVCLDLFHRRLPALVHGGFNWVDVRDVVAGILAAEQHGRTGENYLLSGHWHALAGMVSELTGVPAPRWVVPMWMARLSAPIMSWGVRMRGGENRYSGEALAALRGNRDVRNDKARAELDYAPRPMRETLRDLFAWFEAEGLLAPKPVAV